MHKNPKNNKKRRLESANDESAIHKSIKQNDSNDSALKVKS